MAFSDPGARIGSRVKLRSGPLEGTYGNWRSLGIGLLSDFILRISDLNFLYADFSSCFFTEFEFYSPAQQPFSPKTLPRLFLRKLKVVEREDEGKNKDGRKQAEH
ncbi:MAG TPA: hypothetical protein VHC44_09860 [Verrucomicrobiae bacterium]|nr:hypothetical protein [Verrucomicrobiae bacterium]